MFDPFRHHRQSLRLRQYDYKTAGSYCVTLCTQNRQMLFGEVAGNKVNLTEIGDIVCSEWLATAQRFPSIMLDEFIVMPNHFHGIVFLNPPGQEISADILPTLGDMVGAFKSLSTKAVRHSTGDVVCKFWQKNFYEQIIRSDAMLNGLRQYIQDNPCRWQDDPENNAAPP